ncbi:abortive infection family protein [Bacillus sp. ISL-46]|uniref:abortive infection family protein n=1 Tax=Bacillus sp. ISL-46 TaxID=2819129 RepID=UPI001BEB01EA|nr:abortive infection family protein [Bacillus sp. ISL-46]MBT2722853.1 abortive infection family protein [Bacillus sp. ISL-46]
MNALNKLEKTKVNLCKLIEQYWNNGPFTELYVAQIEEENFYEESRNIIKAIARKQNIKVPDFTQASRNLTEAVYFLTTNLDRDENEYTLKQYVRSCFNEYLDYLEDEQIDVRIIHVPSQIPARLTFAHIKEDLAKCEKRFNEEDYSGAITSARSLVEGVCNEIIVNITGEQIEDKLDLPALFKKVRKHLNLNTTNPNLEAPLKQVISGLINIVNGLAEIRNENGDAHHRRYDVDQHHALVVINSAKTIVTFLFNTYEYQLDKGTLVKA